MATVVEIPLTARPQTFSVVLEGVTYGIRLYWLVPADCWVINISDAAGNLLIGGVPLITGANLLTQYRQYVGPPGQLLVISDHLPPDAVPNFTDLGVTGHLFYLVSGT
jgi:hypothetical protein